MYENLHLLQKFSHSKWVSNKAENKTTFFLYAHRAIWKILNLHHTTKAVLNQNTVINTLSTSDDLTAKKKLFTGHKNTYEIYELLCNSICYEVEKYYIYWLFSSVNKSDWICLRGTWSTDMHLRNEANSFFTVLFSTHLWRSISIQKYRYRYVFRVNYFGFNKLNLKFIKYSTTK